MKSQFGIWTGRFIQAGRSFLRDPQGATAVEYALLLSISIAVVAAVYQLGGGVNALFEKVLTGFSELGF